MALILSSSETLINGVCSTRCAHRISIAFDGLFAWSRVHSLFRYRYVVARLAATGFSTFQHCPREYNKCPNERGPFRRARLFPRTDSASVSQWIKARIREGRSNANLESALNERVVQDARQCCRAPKESTTRGESKARCALARTRTALRAYGIRTNDRLFGCITMYVLA